MSAIASSVLAAIITTVAVQYLFAPRLAARSIRILNAHSERDKFTNGIHSLSVSVGRLQVSKTSGEMTDAMREKFEHERKRWIDQIDKITEMFMDNFENMAGGYLNLNGPRGMNMMVIATEYCLLARMIWISERDLDDRLRCLKEISEPIQRIYAGHAWKKFHLARDIATFNKLKNDLDQS